MSDTTTDAALAQRIAQWETMAREAPDDMAFLSLANAYRDAERLDDAAGAYRKAIELNPGMSRAYQLLGQTLIKLDQTDEATAVLTKGYTAAAERGDVMPQRAIGSLLTEKLGAELPEVKDAAAVKAEVEADGQTVLDRRTGQPQPKLPAPPMRGPVGKFIHDHFGQHTWNQWIGQGTKVINELRLDFSNPDHQDVYDQHMLEWLQVTPEEIAVYENQTDDIKGAG
ncbi:MAG: Fe(2+)-trafficking protein [Planctomycetota bacterium]